MRLAALALPVVLAVVGCTDPTPPEAAVASPSVSLPGGHDSCSLLDASDAKQALVPPSASPAPTPQGDPTRVHNLTLVPTTVTSVLKTPFIVDLCTYSDPNGQSVVVSIYAAQASQGFTGKLSELTDLVRGASQLTIGPTTADYQQTTTSAVLAFQDGPAVVTISYPGSQPAGVSREQRLVGLAARILGVAAPSISPIANPIAEATPGASPTAAPPPGQSTSGATAAAGVNETDTLKFEPASVSVKVGAVVEWTNGGVTPHNVTFAGQPTITSKTMSQNDKFEVKFTVAGTYSYVCTFHVSSGMTGQVTVTP